MADTIDNHGNQDMAGDWIKMRVWLRRDPKVIWMADHLATDRDFMNWLTHPVQRTCDESVYEHVTGDVTRALCVTGLLEVWGTAREQGVRSGDDLIVSKCDLATLDEITGIPSFGEAMHEVGWADETEDGAIIFPKFFADKASPEQRHRTSGAARQARYRNKKRNAAVTGDGTGDVTGGVTAASPVTPPVTIEKRREEKSKKKEDAIASSCPEPAQPASGPSPPATTSTVVLTFPVVGGGNIPHWQLSDAKLEEYRQSFPGIDVLAELRKALQWVRDNPTRRKTPEGMTRFLGSWLGRAQNSAKPTNAPRGDFQTEYAKQSLRGILFTNDSQPEN